MTDPGDELQASHPLRDAKVVVEDIEDNPGFFRVKLYAVPHFRWKAWTSICLWLARCRRRKGNTPVTIRSSGSTGYSLSGDRHTPAPSQDDGVSK